MRRRRGRNVRPPVLTLCLATLAPGAAAGPVVERTVWVMGAGLTVRVEHPDRARGLRAIEAAFDSVRAWDDVLSTWRPDAELARLRAAPPGPVALSPALTRALDRVRVVRDQTRGAFDPAVGALIDVWDLRGRGRVPDPDALRAAHAATGLAAWRAVAPGVVERPASGWLDAGGFGKGLALDAARAALVARGIHSALLNFGGQVMVLGPREDGAAWPVPVAHPAHRDRAAVTLAITDGSAATSGASERWVEVGGRRLGHVLDPRTGRPVPPWGAVTVIDPDAFTADALATALFVMGPADGLSWADHNGVAALFLIHEGDTVTMRCSAAVRSYLRGEVTCD